MTAELGSARIMIVDDAVTNLRLAKSALAGAGDVFTVTSAERMFELMDTALPHLILLDINMPGMDGIEALKALKSKPATADVPVIFLTGMTDTGTEVEGLRLGAVDYIAKPFEPELLRARVGIHLTLRSQRLRLESQSRELERFNRNLQAMVAEEAGKVVRLQGAVFSTVVDLVESRDDITGGHVTRTMSYLKLLMDAASAAGVYLDEISAWDQDINHQSSMLHDVGKISISDSILKKPGRLTEQEFEDMKLHTTFGAAVLDKISATLPEEDAQFMRHARIFAETHHEKWDGTGYPYGLSGTDIPLQGRLMAVCDVYDALISKRPYKEPFPPEKAERIIIEGSGTHFDPALIDVFSKICRDFRKP
ncbi:MAG: response regulator [Deltaproteobacteria bacterium]|jgi:putative two-component system response regulator|nr:response regulator [Deltaproteobacteria bacterium]